MKKIKLITVVGTRPEIIRLSQIIKRLNESKSIEHILVHTGQNYDYELNEVFFKDFGIKKPDYFMDIKENSSSETIGKIIIETHKILKKIKPDAFFVLGDTNSCLAAISAKKLKIPVFHYEAGNRSFDLRVPEEINRKIVDNVSDINLTYSKISREYLLREGFDADKVIRVGSPMKEVIYSMIDKIDSSKILAKLNLRKNNYFLVSAHREENVSDPKNFKFLFDSLNAISKKYNLPVIVSTHPRTQKVIKSSKIKIDKNIILLKPFSFSDYINLQLNSKVVLSDSGTISEEASILGFNALNIRNAHERPEAMEEGVVMMVGLENERIFQGIEILTKRSKIDKIKIVNDYDVDNVSIKIERIIISYINYINKKSWFKD